MLSLFFQLVLSSLVAAQIITIDSIQPYESQRDCVFGWCFGRTNPGYIIASNLECAPFSSPGNSCFCRTDLQQTAVAQLSHCVSVWCDGNIQDISTATKIYKDYCTSAGFVIGKDSVPAQITGGMFWSEVGFEQI
jgi:hypothetical protein